jgi:hypothetical protein
MCGRVRLASDYSGIKIRLCGCPLWVINRHRTGHRRSSDYARVIARSLSFSASKDWMRVRSWAKTLATSAASSF